MLRYGVVSVVSGLLFGVLDAAINANALAQRLYLVFQPIARTSVDPAAGIAIDLAYGFALAGIFLRLHPSLPGPTGLLKGLSFGALVWLLRVVMSVASQWVMFDVPAGALIYTLVTGLAEMLALGILYGLTLEPA